MFTGNTYSLQIDLRFLESIVYLEHTALKFGNSLINFLTVKQYNSD